MRETVFNVTFCRGVVGKDMKKHKADNVESLHSEFVNINGLHQI